MPAPAFTQRTRFFLPKSSRRPNSRTRRERMEFDRPLVAIHSFNASSLTRATSLASALRGRARLRSHRRPKATVRDTCRVVEVASIGTPTISESADAALTLSRSGLNGEAPIYERIVKIRDNGLN